MVENLDQLELEVAKAIYAAFESKLHEIGSVLTADAKNTILAQKIYDKGDFYRNTAYMINILKSGIELRIGSNVKHEPFVLGGKEPSWTPFEPIKAWVERKGLSWVDGKGDAMTVEQMANAIIGKIKREGLPGSNVFQIVYKNRQKWIFDKLSSVEVVQ